MTTTWDLAWEPTRAWLEADTKALLPLTEENATRSASFLLRKWKERASERREAEPADLSNSCKFVTLFVKHVFGGHIEGHHAHQFNVIDGRVVDINRDAADVRRLPDPHAHDESFFANPDHLDSLASCMPRVSRWIDEFLLETQMPSEDSS